MRFEPGKLYSLLDILGGCVVCDGCQKESTSHLTPEMALSEAKNEGWLIDGEKHYCPDCAKKKIHRREKSNKLGGRS